MTTPDPFDNVDPDKVLRLKSALSSQALVGFMKHNGMPLISLSLLDDGDESWVTAPCTPRTARTIAIDLLKHADQLEQGVFD